MSIWLSPALLLGVLFSVGYASLYHLWSGRHLSDLLIALPAALFGFGAGQLLGLVTQAPFQIGQLHMLEASVGAWVALLAMHVLQR